MTTKSKANCKKLLARSGYVERYEDLYLFFNASWKASTLSAPTQHLAFTTTPLPYSGFSTPITKGVPWSHRLGTHWERRQYMLECRRWHYSQGLLRSVLMAVSTWHSHILQYIDAVLSSSLFSCIGQHQQENLYLGTRDIIPRPRLLCIHGIRDTIVGTIVMRTILVRQDLIVSLRFFTNCSLQARWALSSDVSFRV